MNSILKLNSPLNTKPRMSSIRQKATFFLCEKFFYLFMAFFHWKWRENLAWHRAKQIELFFLSFFFLLFATVDVVRLFRAPLNLKVQLRAVLLFFILADTIFTYCLYFICSMEVCQSFATAFVFYMDLSRPLFYFFKFQIILNILLGIEFHWSV